MMYANICDIISKDANSIKFDGLSEDQEKSFNDVKNFLQSDNIFFLLTGFAGTGKTFLIFHIIKNLIDTSKKAVAITATTHKAVKVLMEMAKRQHADFMTIHSLMGLKEHIDHDGNVSFKPGDGNNKIINYDIIFVDEASMLSNEMFNLIRDVLAKNSSSILGGKRPKVIFIGDPAQIPPVNERMSIIMTRQGLQDNRIKVSALKQIIRQAEESPIINLSVKLRSNLNGTINFKNHSVFKEFGCVVVSGESEIHSFIKTLVDDNKFENKYKIIAWRNKTVDQYNLVIRRQITKMDNPPMIVESDKLILNKPIVDDAGYIKMYTNEEVTAKEVSVSTTELKHPSYEIVKDIKYYVTRLYSLDRNYDQFVHIVHEDSIKDFSDFKNELANLIKVEKDKKIRSRRWVEWFKMTGVFAWVKHGYAITSHKAQGSTYDVVIMDNNDISYNPNLFEQNRLRYTAVTRASKALVIIN